MKILFTGGGTGGHFYPIIAVAQEINIIVKEQRLLEPSLYYLAPDPFDEQLLFQNNITFKKSPAGKMRRYFSILNLFDIFKTGWGIVKATFQVFFIYPDVIFSKGGYASFPTVLAAKLFRIPIFIHESDSIPGRVNLWAGKFARRVALSYPEAAKYFPKEKVAHTGNPVRRELYTLAPEGAAEFLHLEAGVPVILILGGSLGAERINDTIIDVLPELVSKYQILHQVGKRNFNQVKTTAAVVLEGSEHAARYQPFEYLNDLALRMAAGSANIIISRAGSTIFEIAIWGIPSIIIPIPQELSNGHQHKNAFTYARSGAAVVIEQKNLTPHILAAEIHRLMDDKDRQKKMREAAKQFAHPDAAKKIAEELIRIALTHESA